MGIRYLRELMMGCYTGGDTGRNKKPKDLNHPDEGDKKEEVESDNGSKCGEGEGDGVGRREVIKERRRRT